nr:LOW QUALITY PROTEIN: zinc finger protein 804A [Pelodiscus sinensis]|eukprot:XP_006121769.1 LOW QUALITY PROTEIN: zinc finger protein 804A [Pelodiscus sinensis]
MECYYFVISSAHLSNGHFRNIKGVFRGPLSKNGNKTLDYAEKENTIAKALEDLKANFYCELCDKQYYKHQEFDNHINSYDHAHKQRLKELKQREFARNVASKSRKDERKQEKALQRLHKLAELRKEAACAPGSGPMFKSTTVTVKDNFHEIPQSTIIDSSNKQQNFNCTLVHNTQNTKEVTSSAFSASETATNNKSDSNKLGDQVQGAQGHKIGFSFAFPKKASVKLESSAAVFYEYNDETSHEHGFSRRSRFVPGTCNLQSPSATEIVLCSEEKHNYIPSQIEKCTNTAEASNVQEPKELSSKENIILENTVLIFSFEQPMSDDLDDYCVDINSRALPDQLLSTVAASNQTLCVENNSSELLGKKSTAFDISDGCLSLQNITEENNQYIPSDSSTPEAEIKKPGCETSSNSEGEITASQNKQETHKRPCEPFVPVLSKHGSSILQWPSEMLIYTCTEPSISYSCNPLCFDFKSSRANNSMEKTKHQPNIPHSHHTTDSNQSIVLDDPDSSISECADYKTESNKNMCDQTTLLIRDVPLAKSCKPATNQGKMCLDASFRIGKTEKYHISKNHLQQDTMIDDKHNKVWNKETHKRWFHKNRKRRRRRKLCPHYYEQTAKAEAEASSTVEQEIKYVNEDKPEHLQNTSEKCRDETGSIWLAAEQLHQACKKLGIENSDRKRTMFTETHIQGDKDPCDTWNTKNRNDHCTDAEPQHRKYKTNSHRQSKQRTLNSGRHNLMCSRTLCSSKVRRSNCSPDHQCLEKYTSQSQSIKRAYNFLTDEPERSHRKRRQHTYSCSSDESTCRQAFLSEEYLRQTSNLAVHCKPKRKRRKKRPRIQHLFVNKESINETHNSTLNILGELLTQENIQQTKAQSTEAYTKNVEQTTELVEEKLTLQSDCLLLSDNNKPTECSALESSPNTYLEDLTHPVAFVIEHGAVTTATPENTLEKEKKYENVRGPESQAAYKVPSIDRNVEQIPHKSYLCHYEVAETIPQEKINETTTEWLQLNSGTFNSPPPLSFKEAHINSHTFLTTEQILAPFTLPDQTLIFPPENHGKFKDLPCEAYQQLMQQNMLANKVKFAFPPTAFQPSNSPLQPLPLQQPLCSTSVTTIHHTVLQQHAAAAAAAAASTFKVLQHPQQFLSQVPTLSRTPLPHLAVGPRLCPGTHTTFVAPPQLPLIPTSVFHPSHLAFSPLPHALFPSLLSPHPAVIPLQPLF